MVEARGYRGSVTTLRRHVRKVRPVPKHEAFFRLSVLPGEQAQVDWGSFGKIRVGRFERLLGKHELGERNSAINAGSSRHARACLGTRFAEREYEEIAHDFFVPLRAFEQCAPCPVCAGKSYQGGGET